MDMDLLKVPIKIQKMGAISMTSLKSSDDDDASGLGYQNTLVSKLHLKLLSCSNLILCKKISACNFRNSKRQVCGGVNKLTKHEQLK
jgi:hypothetical protein